MRVLVTGHLGYLGTEMTSYLLSRGHDVVGLDIDLFRGCDFRGPPDPVPNLGIDLRDVEPADLVGFDAVVHLAALCNDPLSDLDPQLTLEINCAAAVRLASAAKIAGVRRFLFSSSCSMYGRSCNGELDEDARVYPLTIYGESKIRAEQSIAVLADTSFSPVFLRNATAYGVSRRLRADVVVNNLVGHAITSGKVTITSNGSAFRPLVHVLDIAQCFAEVLVAPRAAVHNQRFNVGPVGANYQVVAVANLVASVVPGCSVTWAPGAAPDRRSYRVDFGKLAHAVPRFRPQWTVRRGIEQLRDAYAGGAMSAEIFDGPTYFRLRTVKRLINNGEINAELRHAVLK